MPGPAQPPPPPPPAQHPGWPAPDVTPAAPRRPGRRPGAVLVAEVAAVVMLAVAALGYGSRSGDSVAADDAASAPATTESAPSTTGTTQPVSTTAAPSTSITDDRPPGGDLVAAGGLAYPALGPPWEAATGERYAFVEEMDGEAGQAVEVEDWSRGSYSAFVLVGTFSGGYEVATRGSPDLSLSCEMVAGRIADAYYAASTGAVETVSSEPVTVSDRPAHRVELEVEISDPDLETTSETVIVQIVDVRPGLAAVVYASVPNVRPELRADVDRALAGLRIAA